MADENDKATTEPQETAPETEPKPEAMGDTQPEEQALILGKYKSVDELAKAYKELESRLGRGGETPKDEPKQEANPLSLAPAEAPENFDALLEQTGFDADELDQQFAESGELTDEQYAKFKAPKWAVDAQFKARQADRALGEQRQKDIYAAAVEIAGGEDTLRQLMAWGYENLGDEEKAAYDAQVQSKAATPGTAKMAVRSLLASYNEAVGAGKATPLVTGDTRPSGGRVKVRTADEARSAMRDPRYLQSINGRANPNHDPEYRKAVDAAVNSLFRS